MGPSVLVKLSRVLTIGLIVGIAGCVNVNNTNVPVTNVQDPVTFVNLSGGTSAMSVQVNGSAVASGISFGSASAYANVPAGIEKYSFSYGGAPDTLAQRLDGQKVYTVVGVSDPSIGVTTRTYYFYSTRNTFDVTGVKDSILVRFVNMSLDTAATMLGGADFHLSIGSASDSTMAAGVLSTGSAGPFLVAASANPKYSILSSADGSSIVTATALNGTGGSRYTVILYGSGANIKTLVLKEN